MNDFFSEFGWTIVEIISGLLSLMFLMSIFSNSIIINSHSMSNLEQTVTGAHVSYNIPTVDSHDFVVDNAILEKDSVFNWKDYVHVKTSNDLIIIDYVSVEGEVDTSIPGEYTLVFELNFNGKNIVKQATYYVKEV